MIRTLFTTLTAAAALSSCMFQPTAGVRQLNFLPSSSLTEINPKTLLTDQRIPRDRLMTIPQAMKAAPVGSLMIVCWKTIESPWGPCSHITRKYSESTLTDVVTLGEVTREYPLNHMWNRYAVIVLDTGITPDKLPAMREKAEELRGKPYDISGTPGSYYCSTYQNALEEAMGLPKPMPFNTAWNAYLPADALYLPHVKVRFVGINPKAAYGTPPQSESEVLDLNALEAAGKAG